MAARAGTIIIVSAACIAMISGCGKAHDSNALDQQSDAILRAVPNTVEFVNNAPRNCVEVGIKLSNDEMFAKVWVKHKRANCAGYGGNSYVILRKHGNRWTKLFNGTYAPSCAFGIPSELAPCINRHG